MRCQRRGIVVRLAAKGTTRGCPRLLARYLAWPGMTRSSRPSPSGRSRAWPTRSTPVREFSTDRPGGGTRSGITSSYFVVAGSTRSGEWTASEPWKTRWQPGPGLLGPASQARQCDLVKGGVYPAGQLVGKGVDIESARYVACRGDATGVEAAQRGGDHLGGEVLVGVPSRWWRNRLQERQRPLFWCLGPARVSAAKLGVEQVPVARRQLDLEAVAAGERGQMAQPHAIWVGGGDGPMSATVAAARRRQPPQAAGTRVRSTDRRGRVALGWLSPAHRCRRSLLSWRAPRVG
ncbi:MAG: hypothetical protein JWN84_1651 [Nocardioides sp.]|nr:hypothetical protein [Nocardioides sp.]